MKSMILRPTLIALSALGLAGWSTYDSRGYRYSGVSVGVGSSYPYYGRYDGYYYAGPGYDFYDRRGPRLRWNHRHRRDWDPRRPRSGHRENRCGYRRQWRQDRRD